MNYQVTNVNQHLIMLVMTMESKVLICVLQVNRVNVTEVEQKLPKFLLSILVDVRFYKNGNGGLQNLIWKNVSGEVIVVTNQLLVKHSLTLDRSADVNFTTQRTKRFTGRYVVTSKATLYQGNSAFFNDLSEKGKRPEGCYCRMNP